MRLGAVWYILATTLRFHAVSSLNFRYQNHNELDRVAP